MALDAELLNDAGSPVVCRQLSVGGGRLLAHAELSVAATLNSLSLEMIDLLRPQLKAWLDDPAVAAVVITGAGDKAFCAGGDIQALYRSIRENQSAGRIVNSYPFEFFEREYRLDYELHTATKPVLVLGHGIVMGGGFGILGGGTFRLVTERSRLAFPEVTIGLFPDAGGTWLFRNMPDHLALFLGATGANINAADALACSAATHCIPDALRGNLLPTLAGLDWTGDAAADAAMIGAWLGTVAIEPDLERETDSVPADLATVSDVQALATAIEGLAGSSKWIDKGIRTLQAGCPTTIGIVFEQLKRARTLTLEGCFQLEMTVASQCALHDDFPEGVRALLIDKDGAPQWQPASLAALSTAHVAAHFEAPGTPWALNPLADLGT
ncbi:MAG: enoyl-CoA hydratase/isomerase family protein [Pseudomonadota bacterium]